MHYYDLYLLFLITIGLSYLCLSMTDFVVGYFIEQLRQQPYCILRRINRSFIGIDKFDEAQTTGMCARVGAP